MPEPSVDMGGTKTGSSTFAQPTAQPGVSIDVQRGWGGGAKPPGAVPSGNRNPASPARTTGRGPRSKLAPFTTPPRPSSTGRSTLLPEAPVEPPATAEVSSDRWSRREKRYRRYRLGS